MPILSDTPSRDDFHTLGLEPGASIDQVKKAYRELAKQWHPDRFQQQSPNDRQRSEEKFKEITRAYTRISKALKSEGKTPRSQHAAAVYPGGSQDTDARGERASQRREGGKPRKNRPSAGEDAKETRWPGQRLGATISARNILWTAVALVACGLIVSLMPTTSTSPPGMPTSQPGETERYLSLSPRTDANPPQRDKAGSSRNVPEQGTMERPALAPSDARPQDNRELQTPHFTLGSTEAEVLRVQGPPNRVHGQTWVYGLSEVQFRDGRVWRYNNFDHSLRVRLHPAGTPAASSTDFFSLGSTKDEVLAVQGTPTRVDGSKWTFGFSEVRFRNGRVEDYDNYFGNLKVRLMPSQPAGNPSTGGYFTIGSTQDEVLAAQGTPTSIQGNFWFYQFSNILFRDGKVQHVVNAAGNLHFIAPDEVARRENAP